MSTQIEQLQAIIAALAIREPDSEHIADLEQQRDDWKHRAEHAEAEAENAKRQREAWEENHQILSEHFQRMTERAEKAEAQLRAVDG